MTNKFLTLLSVVKKWFNSNLFIRTVVEYPIFQGWDIGLLRRVREICVEPGRSEMKQIYESENVVFRVTSCFYKKIV